MTKNYVLQYTGAEIDNLLSKVENMPEDVSTLKFEIVNELPTTDIDNSTIYLIKTNIEDYEEYIYIDNKWEMLGTTKIDLTGYATETYVDEKFNQIDIDAIPKAPVMYYDINTDFSYTNAIPGIFTDWKITVTDENDETYDYGIGEFFNDLFSYVEEIRNGYITCDDIIDAWEYYSFTINNYTLPDGSTTKSLNYFFGNSGANIKKWGHYTVNGSGGRVVLSSDNFTITFRFRTASNINMIDVWTNTVGIEPSSILDGWINNDVKCYEPTDKEGLANKLMVDRVQEQANKALSYAKLTGMYNDPIFSSDEMITSIENNFVINESTGWSTGNYKIAANDNIIIVFRTNYSTALNYYSTNGGTSWTNFTFPTLPDGTTAFIPYDIIYDKDKFIVVGKKGGIATSTDGLNWSVQQVSTYNLEHIAYQYDRYVANGSGSISYSTDGYNWTSTSISPNSYGQIAYNGTTWVCCDNRVSYTNYPSSSWYTASTPMDGITPRAAYYYNNQFVVVGDSGMIMTSPDGKVWTIVGQGLTKKTLSNLKAINNEIIAFGSSADTIVSSYGGQVWDKKSNYNGSCYGITYAQNKYFMTSSNKLITANSKKSIALSIPHYAEQYENNMLVNISTYNLNDGYTYERDAFETYPTYLLSGINYIDYYDGKYVAITRYGEAMYSFDGYNWMISSYPPSVNFYFGSCRGLTHGINPADNKTYFIAVYDDYISYSTNGDQWTTRVVVTDESYNSIAYGNNTFVIVTADGKIRYSNANITSWALATTISNAQFIRVKFLNNQFIAAAKNGLFAFSTDGITWTTTTYSDVTYNDCDFDYGNNTYIIVTDNNKTLITSDFVTFTTKGRSEEAIAFDGTNFIVANFSTLYSSSDGASFTKYQSLNISSTNEPHIFNRIFYINGRLMAPLSNGSIYQYKGTLNKLDLSQQLLLKVSDLDLVPIQTTLEHDKRYSLFYTNGTWNKLS